MLSKKLMQIVVNQQNYLALKNLGNAGDSFNDVITVILKKVESLQAEQVPHSMNNLKSTTSQEAMSST